MPDIAPFRGVRFASARVPPGSGICPPYDVIDATLHRRLLDLHPMNAVRWILGARPEQPQGGEEEYRRRGEEIRSWMRDGVLVREESPALYGYEHRYRDLAGDERVYSGLLVALAATPWREKRVLPHEQVHAHIVEDRFVLLRESGIDMGVVQIVIDDRGGEVARTCSKLPREVLWDAAAWDGARHRMTCIQDRTALLQLGELLAERTAVVADGHHRYTTMLQLSEERGRPARMLAAIGDLFHDGVRILPTPRMLVWRGRGQSESRATVDAFIARLHAALDDRAGETWIVEDAEGRSTAIRSRDDETLPTLARRLEQLLEKEEQRPSVVTFHDAGTAERALRAESSPALLCRVPPVGKEEFWRRATRGEIFPAKTTFFQPKIATGLVARFVDEE